MRDAIDRIFLREPGWDVYEVSLDRIRHSLGFRGIVQYRVVFQKGSIRKEVWVAGSTYADGRGSGLAAKLEKAARSFEPPLQTLVAFEPRYEMLFQVFPLDRRLPGALICGDRKGREKWLPEGTFTTVRHRLGQSATVKIDDSSRTSYVKFRREGETLKTVFQTTRLRNVVPEVVGLALPHAGIPEIEATVTDSVEGTRVDADCGRSLGLVAEGLHAMH
ncbi:MAG: hypothetical protein H0U53_10560, partial [Actinobacteria bacterium]|nr:hypothetical protein [Actinomycetota bacterium]